ncbi:hypothetical protein V2J09_018522 [Rumex salicifolius]
MLLRLGPSFQNSLPRISILPLTLSRGGLQFQNSGLNRMDVLYNKLYKKYSILKTKRISQLDQVNHDLEKNFQDYLTAADAYIEQLNGENEKLRGENEKLLANNNDLLNEVGLLRSEKDQKYEDSQKLLSEERQKNEELTKEIDNLVKLQQEGKNQNQETDTPKEKNVRKRRRLSGEASVTVSTERILRSKSRRLEVSEPSISLSKESIHNVDHEEPQCCRNSNNSGSCNCLFQVLVECFTGMKVSVVRQADGEGICALHQSSGYSFDLTWLKKSAVDETHLLYQVSSLGTFDRIAPEWMREAIIFSMSMCPVFFERLSRVIKHH